MAKLTNETLGVKTVIVKKTQYGAYFNKMKERRNANERLKGTLRNVSAYGQNGFTKDRHRCRLHTTEIHNVAAVCDLRHDTRVGELGKKKRNCEAVT